MSPFTSGVILEDYVFCGPSMVFTNVLTPRSEFPRDTAEHYHETRIKRGASIGAQRNHRLRRDPV